jgi:hypothetical protein
MNLTDFRQYFLLTVNCFLLSFTRVLLSMELCMATCYRKIDPKYFPDAMSLYKKIIEKFPENIAAKNVSGLSSLGWTTISSRG